MPKRLLLIGGGGHCCSVLDCLLTQGDYDDLGIVDLNPDTYAMGVPVVGTDDDLPRLREAGWTHAFVTVGSVGDTTVRRRLYQKIADAGFEIPNIVADSAEVARDVFLFQGVFVAKRAVVNARTRVGEGAIINTGAIVEHDCLVYPFAHISPGAVLCGHVRVGNDAHVGAGSVVRQGIDIGPRALIGAGSVVVRNIPEAVKAWGNPCREVK